MGFRSVSTIAILLIGLGGLGCQAFAQYYPYAYPALPGAPYRPHPPIDTDDDDDPRDTATLPPEVRLETGPKKELPPQSRRTLADYETKEPVGTIIVDTPNTYLYLVLGNGKALRYGIGVGREGFTWSGVERISRMAEWPDWNPPETMIDRQPYLPRFMAGGDGNPLGARALYLGQTLYRIHGTNQPSTIGTFVSSGCIRLTACRRPLRWRPSIHPEGSSRLYHLGSPPLQTSRGKSTSPKRLPRNCAKLTFWFRKVRALPMRPGKSG
jgi:lipoprotein-anchoring transpeptidase ErfK/SrfK